MQKEGEKKNIIVWPFFYLVELFINVLNYSGKQRIFSLFYFIFSQFSSLFTQLPFQSTKVGRNFFFLGLH